MLPNFTIHLCKNKSWKFNSLLHVLCFFFFFLWTQDPKFLYFLSIFVWAVFTHIRNMYSENPFFEFMRIYQRAKCTDPFGITLLTIFKCSKCWANIYQGLESRLCNRHLPITDRPFSISYIRRYILPLNHQNSQSLISSFVMKTLSAVSRAYAPLRTNGDLLSFLSCTYYVLYAHCQMYTRFRIHVYTLKDWVSVKWDASVACSYDEIDFH